MRTLLTILSCLVILFLSVEGFAVQKKSANIQITGLYSNMYYVPEAGDVVGVEIFIVSGGDGYYASVQVAEGAPAPPVITKVIVNGASIEFTLPEAGKYTGKISTSGLTGKFGSEAKASFLKRKNSYWQ